MCGIFGIFHPQVEKKWIQKMARILRHRGPDDEGFLAVDTSRRKITELSGEESQVSYPRIENFSQDADLFLGHRRLNILDISTLGHQPMANCRRDLWIIYNGEIYNYVELREELRSLGHHFSTNCDTEVLLASYEEWGVDCLHKFNGMWAFVIYDVKKNELFAARDRFGVKPLYYVHRENTLIFASEIKAIVSLPIVEKQINPEAVFDYLVLGWEEYTEESFWSQIYELPPSFAFRYDFKNRQFHKWKYYELHYTEKNARFQKKSFQEMIENTRQLMVRGIEMRLRSDVPVGSCLSGGLDSSTIVCIINELLQKRGISQVGDRQKVFTTCYRDSRVDESSWAKMVVEKTGASWKRTFPTAEEFRDDLSEMVYTQDIPFGSTSIYAQYRVMKLASENGITVLLDGQGGDEIFTGYKSYYVVFFAELLKHMNFFSLLREGGHLRTSPIHPKYLISGLIKLFGAKFTPDFLKPFLLQRIAKENQYLNPEFWNQYKFRLKTVEDRALTSLNQMLYSYITKVKLKPILRYADRNSMRFSIESRPSFADDIDLIKYLFQIPSVYKIYKGWSKYILREATSGLLPEKIRWRRDKLGFATPEYSWLNQISGSLLEYFDEKLSKFLNVSKLKKDWDHLIKAQSKTGITTLWRFINLAIWMDVYQS